jgi:thiol:disulfide interchange protein
MKKIYFICYVLLAAVILATCAKKEYKEMRVYPVVKELTVAQGDDSFIAIRVEIPSGYHIYGNPKGPGVGKPTQLNTNAGGGIIVRDARYLEPQKFYYPEDKDYTLVYENETTIFLPFKVSDKASVGIHSFGIIFDSLLCNYSEVGAFTDPASSCIPKIFNLNYAVRVLPKGSISFQYPRSIISEYALSQSPGIEKRAIQNFSSAGKIPVDSLFPSEIQFEPRFIQSRISGLLEALIFSILAGFILNFMPCVLPVVSLKVMSFVQHADKNRKEVFLLGLTFSLGILTCFALLAALAAFFGYKWGGLFQHRIFLVIMTGFVFALALSLFGVFTIQIPAFIGRALPQRHNVFADAYIKGLFATLLATPCSGPFLGGTLAWTLSKPPYIIFMIFLCIGAGMSLPYLILTINPKFLKLIPKPGEWMKTFEQIMAFFLVFTAVYLLGVFDPATKMPVVALLAFIAVGFWQYGKYGSRIYSYKKRLASFAFLVIIVGGGYLLSFNYLYTENTFREIPQGDFSVCRMLENRRSGRITMIEFTASWCPNCKLVEKTSLFTDAVAKAVKENNIDFLKADITNKNPAAEQLLALLQSQSIPLLAVMPSGPSFEKPIILRDIYSERDVLDAVNMAEKVGMKDMKKKYRFEIDMK